MLIPDSFVVHAANVIDYGHGKAENLLLQSRVEPDRWSWWRLWEGRFQSGADGWPEKSARAFFAEAI